MPEYSAIGKRLKRVDALAKVTGKALYAADYSLPNMLFGKVLWSPYASARIRRLDVTKALALDGVIAVVTAEDVHEHKSEEGYPDPMTSCMAKERVIFAGQPVAAVAALDHNTAEEALKLIEVDYEELTPAIDVLDAMKPDAPVIHSWTKDKNTKPSNVFRYTQNIRGDIEKGFKEADVVLENTFRTQTVHHTYMEPRAVVANVDAEGKVTLWADNQGTFECRELVAEYLGLPLHYVKVIPTESGGAFGGKSHQVVPPICALLSKKTGRPVKIVTTREEVFKTNRPPPASVITVKLGATKDGRLTAASVTLVYDFGASFGMGGMPAVPNGSFTGLNPYRVPNFKIDTYSVFTNKTPTGPYRAPSAPQAAFAVESQMDLVARELKMNPLELRLKNAVAEGDTMTTGMPFLRIGFKQTIERMQQYLAQKGELQGENRGRGIACGFLFCGAGASGAHINLNADGTVSVLTGAVDVSGTRTILTQVVAEELGIPSKDITVITGDTDMAPYSVFSAGSMIARAASLSVYQACQNIKEQVCQRGASKLKVEPKDVEYVKGRVQVKGTPEKSLSLADVGRSLHHFPLEPPITGQGTGKVQNQSMVFAVETADVEVDKETGKVKVLSYAVAQDVGFAVNPTLLECQIQGAITQGIGWALWENSVYDKGVMQNANLLDYRIPTAVDVPSADVLLVEVPHSTSPFGIRGAGEPPLVPALATIANAIHSATGVMLKELPMNPEAVFRALHTEDKPK
ncbi:MAG: xanthine dehydrogenase family protein molybdopterin-binding subunit [Chloroflexota bacterium]